MSEITLEAVQAKQAELAIMIAALAAQAGESTLIEFPEVSIELRRGDHYAGVVLNEDGTVKHHLILLREKPDSRMSWGNAKAWAATTDGELPTRQEAALVFANCKPHVDADWHWTSEEHDTNDEYAWTCYFDNGYQSYYRKYSEGLARAVRRI